jgi:diphthamide synthase subunit DPH2
MIFHIGHEIPTEAPKHLDAETERYTPEEVRIVKTQIQKNKALIDECIRKIDLFVNQERYPHREQFLEKMRNRLFLLMDENDTFRKVLWKHYLQENMGALS